MRSFSVFSVSIIFIIYHIFITCSFINLHKKRSLPLWAKTFSLACYRTYHKISNDSTLIAAHNVGRNCIGDKSFYVTAPRLWNALLKNIQAAKSLTVFKKLLKSHLYPKYWLALCLYLHLFSTFVLWSRWKSMFYVCVYVYYKHSQLR